MAGSSTDIRQIIFGAIICFGGIIGLASSSYLPNEINNYVSIGTIIAIIVGIVIAVPPAIKRFKNI